MILLRFSRGTGFAGSIVRWGTRSATADVGLKLETGLVLDSTPSLGVSIRDAVDDETTQYFKLVVPTAHISAAVDLAKEQLGRPYDWTALGAFVSRRDWWDDKAWFSSELIAAAFDHAGWPLVRDGRRFDRVTPRDLLLSTRIMPANKGG